jgi:hypothetical protein
MANILTWGADFDVVLFECEWPWASFAKKKQKIIKINVEK